MAGAPFTLSPDYWQTFSLGKKDLEFINTHLFENETPLNEAELVPLVVEERIREEREALVKGQESNGRAYLPAERYAAGDKLVFPALDWKKGQVKSVRPGLNPALGEFEVIEVALDDGSERFFAAGLAEHKLNEPVEISSSSA